MNNQLEKLFSRANSITITSHISPDPDAIGSTLFMYHILIANYPDKKISMSIDGELDQNLTFLKYFDRIKQQSLIKTIKDEKSDLLILLDGNEFRRFTRSDPVKLKDNVTAVNCKVIIIDHHPLTEETNAALYIQKNTSSTAELIYESLDKLIKLDKDSAEALLVSIVGDTDRFLYPLRYPSLTFGLVTKCFEQGILIEDLSNKMVRFKRAQLLIIAELLKNTVVTHDYTYSFYSREFLNNWLTETNSTSYEAAEANHSYIHTYLRAINGNLWGFVITPHPDEKTTFKVSFRADNAAGIDTTVFSKPLGGGGHKPTSGAEFKAKNITEAIAMVKKVTGESPAY